MTQPIKMEQWTSGSAYEQWMGRWSRLLARQFLDWLHLPAAANWLDLCCGSGIVTDAIVQDGSPKKVIGVDRSHAQVAFAREKRAHNSAAFCAADAMALPFADASFDVAVCGLGLNFIPEPKRALQEMRRVTRRGGTVAGYVWDYAQGARFLREFWDVAVSIDPQAAQFDQARRFPICSPDELRMLFHNVNLENISVQALELITQFESFDDYWEPFLSGQGSAPNYLASRDHRTRDAIRDRLRASLPADSAGSIALPARAWAVRATSPSPLV
jgi:SAM-dependent methyltransferase